jgi:hypothetical protein
MGCERFGEFTGTMPAAVVAAAPWPSALTGEAPMATAPPAGGW